MMIGLRIIPEGITILADLQINIREGGKKATPLSRKK
jgi:hypothetical protein